MMDTCGGPRPHPHAAHARTDIDGELDHYCSVVTDVFSHHRHVRDCGDDRCACGAMWPCLQEQLAAQLLDWLAS